MAGSVTKSAKGVFGALIICLFSGVTQFAQAACDLSNLPNIDGLRIGMTADEFLSMHPTAEISPLAGDKTRRQSRLDFPMRNGEVLGVLRDTGGVDHIATLDGVVYSYAISFLDAGADYETPLNEFKDMLVKRYRLPTQGWLKASAHSVKLYCAPIRIEVFQDHGAQHTAIGPTLFVRDVSLSKIVDRLK